ncbi:MAG: sigma 54-interacting transcriptional regulator, partial [Planctomycetota bacterium]
FVAVDCGALPEPLMESLLFGHRKGAFTGADRDRGGLFRKADGGTLFLDELGNLSLGLQAKLLRSLQEREVLPLGSERPVPFDVRLIAAANQNLQNLIQDEKFRLDLFHRISEFVIRIPPLRERHEDILHFARLFLAQVGDESSQKPPTLASAAEELLVRQPWSGNLRELRNCMRRAALIAHHEVLEPGDLDLDLPADSPLPSFQDGSPLKEQVQVAAEAIERTWISEALQAAGGNKAEAARRLRIDYSTLHRKLKKYGLDTMADPP